MRTKIFICMMALVFSGALQAQEHLKAVVDKCMNMKEMDVEVLYSKNPKTRKPESKMIKITYIGKEYPKLTDELLEAFRKDQEAAYKIVENNKNQKRLYRFAKGTTDISVSIERINKGADRMQLIYIERYDFDYNNNFG